MLRIHNTLSGKLEEFRPMVDGEVKFYYCGPTVWDYGHIESFQRSISPATSTAPANVWTPTSTRRKTRAISLSGKPQTNQKNRPGTPASDAAGQVGISSARPCP